MNKILNYIKVDNNISTSGQPTIEQFKTISNNGFDVVINLSLNTTHNALKNEDRFVSENGMDYYHIPVSWDKPEQDNLNLFLYILQALQKENKKVFIHCAKNYRVSMFMYCYKKNVLKDINAKLVTPNDFIPNETWNSFLQKVC